MQEAFLVMQEPWPSSQLGKQSLACTLQVPCMWCTLYWRLIMQSDEAILRDMGTPGELSASRLLAAPELVHAPSATQATCDLQISHSLEPAYLYASQELPRSRSLPAFPMGVLSSLANRQYIDEHYLQRFEQAPCLSPLFGDGDKAGL
jgi:hypothetical protein